MNAYVEGNDDNENGNSFGYSLEHRDECAQVEGDIVNLMVQHTYVKQELKNFHNRIRYL